jgi:hypothetical protein
MVENFKLSYKPNVMARCLCTYGACRETMSLNLLRRDDGKLAYIHNHHTPIRGDGGDRAERRSHSNVWLQVTLQVTTRHQRNGSCSRFVTITSHLGITNLLYT